MPSTGKINFLIDSPDISGALLETMVLIDGGIP